MRGMARDVTQRIEAERQLRKSEERFRVALKAAPLVIFNQDRDLRYTWVYNPTLFWAAQNYLGKTDADIAGPEVAASLNAFKQQVLNTGKGRRQEQAIVFQNKKYYYDITIEPLFDALGNVVGITGGAIEITELKEKTEQLRALSKKLAQEKIYLESEIEAEHHFAEIVGESAVLKRALNEVKIVAATNSTVLILGETGTGKELVARAVHRMSPRSQNGFIKLNCCCHPHWFAGK